MQIQFQSIGVIHSPFTSIENMPIQPSGALGVQGSIIVDDAWLPALQDLTEFSHLILLYHFHRVSSLRLKVKPFLDADEHGLFATRAPQRPNPIGLSVVKLLSIENNLLSIENVDILDGTPLLDIKPYVPAFDGIGGDVRIGWLQGKAGNAVEKRSDDRFA